MRTPACLMLLAAVCAAQSPAFPARLYDTALAPQRLYPADVNLDGTGDYVMLLLGNKLSVQLGLASGGIGPPANKLLGSEPYDLAIGLLDGDAWPDIVSANASSLDLSFVYGAGGGDFQPVQSLPVGASARSVALGDFQGDGAMDLVVGEGAPATGGTGAVRPWMADGAGGFTPGASVTLPLNWNPNRLHTAQLDADVSLDALVISHTHELLLLRGDGAGGLLEPEVLDAPDKPWNAVIDDLDEDGDLDIAVECGSTLDNGVVVLFLADGLGSFALAPETLAIGAAQYALAAADLDADGDTDLGTVGSGSAAEATVLLNDGGAGFQPGSPLAVPGWTGGLVLQDATADGWPDLVVLDTKGLSVLPGDGAGDFPGLARQMSKAPNSASVADLNHDGAPDLVTSQAVYATAAGVVLADGSGGYLPEVSYGLPGDSYGFDVGDLNGDGHPDVVAAAKSRVSVLVGDGSGALAPPINHTVSGLNAWDLVLDDVDLDGSLDALVACSAVTGALEGALLIMAGDGGGLAATANYPTGGPQRARIVAGDLDGDGRNDAVLAHEFAGVISTLRSAGGLLFSPAQTWPLTHTADDAALGDLDLDGHLDVVACDDLGELSVLLGDGAGGLLPATAVPDDDQSLGLDVADLNGDGWPDVAKGRAEDGGFSVLLNDGTGVLLSGTRFQTSGGNITGVSITDLDGDFRPDVVTSDDSLTNDSGSVVASLNATAPFVWSDLGLALPGGAGAPQLVGTGSLLPASPGDLRLFHARPFAPSVLFVALSSEPAAFKGGTLVPWPPALQLAVVTDGAGAMTLAWCAWPSASPGQDWYFQYGIADPAAVHGVALSNALRATEP